MESNIVGFYNIIENVKKYKIKRLFYASSSSVYGENNNFPINEREVVSPKNIYGLSKKVNEEIGFIFNKFYKVKLTGLRFFTIYGEWGSLIWMMLKFIESYFKKKLLNYIILGTTLETLHTLVMPRRLCTYSLKNIVSLKVLIFLIFVQITCKT